MAPIPPKALREYMEKHQDLVQSVASVVLRQLGLPARPPPDSQPTFPVLHAFQEFLQAERRRVRRRAVIAATVFTLSFLLLVGGGMAWVLMYVHHMRQDFLDLQGQAVRFEDIAQGLRATSHAVLAKVEERQTQIRTQWESFQHALQKLQTDIHQQEAADLARIVAISNALQALERRHAQGQKALSLAQAEASRPVGEKQSLPTIGWDHRTASPPFLSPVSTSSAPTVRVAIAIPGRELPVFFRVPLPE